MALFGRRNGQRPDVGRALTFALGGYQGIDRRDERAAAEQALRAQTMAEDRLRAALSPADGPMGSGTGVAPTIEQQMAALDQERLLNPAVADKFAPLVAGGRMAEMTAGLPLEQRLAIELNPERAGQSFATQFEDMPLAMGTIRSRGNQAVIGAPRVEQFDDRFGSYDPITGQTSFSEARGPTFSEQTARITADRPQLTTVSPGQQVFGVGSSGQTVQLAESTQPRPPSAQSIEIQGQLDTNANEVIPTLNQMRSALQSGDVITGFGAEARLSAARALAATGNRDAQRVVAATEAYRNMSGRLRVGMAKTLGANPSNADIKLLEQVTGGDIGQNADSLLATIDQGLSFANNKAAALSAQLNQSNGQAQRQQGGGDRAAQAREILRQRGRL